jgi:hypothetical protein
MALQKRTAIVALIVGAALAVAAVLLIPVVFGILTSSQTIPSNGIINPQFSTINRSLLLSLGMP